MRTRRPSPSMIVALIALVLAVGGSAFAAGVAINGKLLKNGSVTGKKLAKDTLTGTQIKESKLGKVPRAANADRATSAVNATNAVNANSALRAATAASATDATNATNAVTATNATNANHAASADDASTVGGIAPSNLVHGTGETFSFNEQLSANTPAAKAFTIPGLGDLDLGCSAGAQTLITLHNGTGQTVDDSNSFETGLAGSAAAGGATVVSNATLISVSGIATAQYHFLLAWPSGTHTHSAEIALGFYSTPANKCAVIISGVVR